MTITKKISNLFHTKNDHKILFVKKTKAVKGLRKTRPLIFEYKLLFFMYLILGLPYTPKNLQWSATDTNCLRISRSFVLNIFRALMGIFSLCYTGFILPDNSLVITFNTFILLSMIVNWCLFFKRRAVIQSAKMIISVADQVSPRNFKSKWNVYLVLVGVLVACLFAGSSIVLVCVKSYQKANVTSSYFLWYEVTEEYSGMFRNSLAISTAVTFIDSGAVSCITITFVCTVYFHLGDIISNFLLKVMRKFDEQPISRFSLSENLCMFQRISSLNQTVNRAFSIVALLIYGVLVAVFFTAICMLRSLDSSDPELIILMVTISFSAAMSFFFITGTGNRVMREDEKFKEKITGCSRMIIDSDLGEKNILRFSLMLTEMRSVRLQVSGGGMFVISSHLILTVTGTMMTYGVLIFQMD